MIHLNPTTFNPIHFLNHHETNKSIIFIAIAALALMASGAALSLASWKVSLLAVGIATYISLFFANLLLNASPPKQDDLTKTTASHIITHREIIPAISIAAKTSVSKEIEAVFYDNPSTPSSISDTPKAQTTLIFDDRHFNILPRDLWRLITRLAFSTMDNVSSKVFQFEHPSTKSFIRLYNKIETLSELSQQLSDTALSANRLFLEQIVLDAIEWAIWGSKYFSGIGLDDDEIDKIVASRKSLKSQVDSIQQSKDSLKNKLQKLSKLYIHEDHSTVIMTPVAELFVTFCNKDLILSVFLKKSFQKSLVHPCSRVKWRVTCNRFQHLALKYGANPNGAFTHPHTGVLTPFLHHFLREGEISIVETLIKRKADLERRNSRGETALHVAAAHSDCYDQRYSLILFLGNGGANLEAKNQNGDTAVLISVKRKLWLNATRLADLGANLRVRDSVGRSLLDHVRLNYTIDWEMFREERFTAAQFVYKVESAENKDT